MAIIVAGDQVAKAMEILTNAGEKVFHIGVVEARAGAEAEQVILDNTGPFWPC
jgi:phosphoribosylaminoimidazole (AIR) synthetase